MVLDVIHKNFLSAVFSAISYIFAKETVLAVDISLHFYDFSIEKLPKTWLPERSFIVLDVIHKNF